MKVVYIAAPYSGADQVANVRDAMACWHRLWESGVIAPVCPHLSMLLHLHQPLPYEEWMEYDLCLLERCDALLRIGGASAGADRESLRMKALGRPVFVREDEVVAWARREASAERPGTWPLQTFSQWCASCTISATRRNLSVMPREFEPERRDYDTWLQLYRKGYSPAQAVDVVAQIDFGRAS